MAIDPKNRPVRVINDDTTEQELAAGHIIPGADPPKNEDARGGFGNRDGKQGFGTDSSDGISAVSVNEDADKPGHPADNIRGDDEGRPVVPNEDMPTPDMLDPRRLPDVGDEIDGDTRRARNAGEDLTDDDDFAAVDRRNSYGEDEDAPRGRRSDNNPERGAAINYNSPASDATTATNAEQNDPNAQESALDI
ncbi:hypothetical protein F0P96_08755 [Hymenobacter busanensis]|uniref:Uncharacterized protein n=1 Tax=Hymenobacter busanensis TaxID=2607656 RepID=A0A7L4ZYB5_9BACT|nr:hypothetical protein [Hymenobacter busanensis]KAA9333064.1 hypothetical protein F0P96_08755 [Hymenobacter busanensis]QHJ08261.1 hypothetical protein GUY19_13570 [Hymenobacter busanensis]